MVNYVTVIVLVALVGISSALPQRNSRARVHRQNDADADVPAVEDNTLSDPPASEAPVDVTVAPRQALDDDTVDVGGEEDNTLGLPSNATSIRAKISATFSCEGRNYGYYADVDNECQIFHVCLPVVNAGSRSQTFKWSFICPEQTIFNQESFTCTRPEDSAACDDAPSYYRLNDNFGVTTESNPDLQSRSAVADVPQSRSSAADLPADDVEAVAPVDPAAPVEAEAPAEASEEVTTPAAEELS